MCGLVGMFSRSGSVARDLPLLPQLVELMARRGPDDSGQWTDGTHLALGFRRLAVLDPSPAGHQPMVSPDGRHVVAFNGEIYNFRELRARLEGDGVRFRSCSDTEVVLHAVTHWGTSALERFNGMFALAWYDTVERRLLLARDAVGIKPLYYLEHADGIVFGSQYDQLLRHPACDRTAIRPDVLGLYLRLGYIPSPYALIAGTRQLAPGTFLEVSAGAGTVGVGGGAKPSQPHRFRDLPAPSSPLVRGQAADDLAYEGVRAAVARQTVSDVPTGAFLSGGVDSPLVAAVMRDSAGWPIPAFTVGSTEPALDESREASTYAHHLGLDHHLRTFTAGDALALLDDMASAYSEPFGDHSALPTMLVSSVARERVKVALAGDGGDEAFWGYPRFRKVLRARGWFAWPLAARWAAYAATKPWPSHRPPRGITFPTIGDWYLDSHSGLRPRELARLCPEAASLPGDFHLYDGPEHGDAPAVAQWLRANELRGHLEMMLRKVDRASMFYGLEVRVPLLDIDVLDVASRLHPGACMDSTAGKLVLRRALGRFVPASSIPVAKRGFDVPVGQWLRRELRPRVQALLLDRDPFPTGLFDRGALAEYVQEHVDGSADHTQGLWNLLALQLWADTHVRTSVSPVTASGDTA